MRLEKMLYIANTENDKGFKMHRLYDGYQIKLYFIQQYDMILSKFLSHTAF